MNSPLISIIIPAYNTEKYLPKCLDSAVSQSFKDIEIIVVDDGSPGNCKEICASYPVVQYHTYGENRGLFSAREYGLRRARGQYILNLDSDDRLPLDACAHIAKLGDFDLLLSEVISVYPSRTEKSRWADKGLKRVGAGFFDFYCRRGYTSKNRGNIILRMEFLKKCYPIGLYRFAWVN